MCLCDTCRWDVDVEFVGNAFVCECLKGEKLTEEQAEAYEKETVKECPFYKQIREG